MVDPTSAIDRARSLRRDMTETERRLWHCLRDRRIGGHKFVRQPPVGRFFADFGCRNVKLIVELDGSQHADSPTDARRDAFLTAQGYSVLRFWKHEVSYQRSKLLTAGKRERAPPLVRRYPSKARQHFRRLVSDDIIAVRETIVLVIEGRLAPFDHFKVP